MKREQLTGEGEKWGRGVLNGFFKQEARTVIKEIQK